MAEIQRSVDEAYLLEYEEVFGTWVKTPSLPVSQDLHISASQFMDKWRGTIMRTIGVQGLDDYAGIVSERDTDFVVVCSLCTATARTIMTTD